LEQLEFTEGSVSLTSLLLELLLELGLKEGRIGVVIEVDSLLKEIIRVSGHVVEETLGDLGLTATSITDE
jgi:hypothetical protein